MSLSTLPTNTTNSSNSNAAYTNNTGKNINSEIFGVIVTLSAIDKMFEIFGPIFEQNANVNFEPIFEQNVNFGPIFEKNANFGPIFV